MPSAKKSMILAAKNVIENAIDTPAARRNCP